MLAPDRSVALRKAKALLGSLVIREVCGSSAPCFWASLRLRKTTVFPAARKAKTVGSAPKPLRWLASTTSTSCAAGSGVPPCCWATLATEATSESWLVSRRTERSAVVGG